MKDKTKRTLKNVFASLISNDAAIDGAKTAPWWIAIIFLVLGTFMPIIPIMVNNGKAYGASFMAKDTFGYEQALAAVSNKLELDGYSFTVNEKHELIAKQGETVLENRSQDNADLEPIAYYNATIKVNGVDREYRALNVFYTDGSYTDLRKNVEKTQYYFLTELKSTDYDTFDDGTKAELAANYHLHMPSYLILYKGGLSGRIYKYSTTTAYAASYDGADWKKLDAGTELLSLVNNVEGFETTDAATRLKDINYVNGVKANWTNVFNKSYANQKVKTFWFSSGLYYGIYLALAFFMGLLMFLLTRGRNNPNRNMNLWITLKISMWIDFTPGVLAMILSFIWSPTAGIGYIAILGIRTMWLSMRQLNPSVSQ